MAILKKNPNSVEFRQEEYQKAGNALRGLVKQSQGRDITQVLTVDNVSKALQEKNCDEIVRMQMCIFMREGNVARYITQNKLGVCSIEYNNIVMSATERSGLDQRTVIALLNVVLYALSKEPEQRYSAKVSDEKLSGIWAITSKLDEQNLRNVRAALNEYVDNGHRNDIAHVLDDLNIMANAGIPEALYLKGKCYYEGIGMPKDTSAAYPYLAAACHGGSAEANAMLGDYYFERQDISFLFKTEAYERYTALGAVALSEKRQDNLKALIEERAMNKKFVVGNFLAFIIAMVLNVLLTKGVFLGGQRHIFWGVVAIIFSMAVFGFSVFEFIKWPYDEQRWVVPALGLIILLLMLIAL